jgi:hypothetical protein
VREAVLDAWRSFERTGRPAERPGLARSVPVIELLDDDVDLAPARHLPPAAVADGAEQLTAVRERLGATLSLTADRTPPPAVPAPGVRWPLTTVGELARGGALAMRTGGNGGHARVPVLTDHDVLAGTAPSGTLPVSEEEAVLTEPGDIVVPVLGGGAVARVIDDATGGAALGRNLVLLRPDRTALDRGSSPASCVAPRTTGRPAAMPPPRPGWTCAGSSCPGSRWTNNGATVRVSARSTSSSGRCGSRAGSGSNSCAGCTTG